MLVIIFMTLPNLDGIGRYQNKWMDRWMEQKGMKEAREERKGNHFVSALVWRLIFNPTCC